MPTTLNTAWLPKRIAISRLYSAVQNSQCRRITKLNMPSGQIPGGPIQFGG
jgi:hypothetical protein